MSAALGFLALKPQELQLFERLFSLIDVQRSGSVSGKQVFNLFITSRLPRKQLALIWNIASARRSGELDRDGFFVACRLVALAQQNLPISQQSLATHRDVPLPMFSGPAQQYYPREYDTHTQHQQGGSAMPAATSSPPMAQRTQQQHVQQLQRRMSNPPHPPAPAPSQQQRQQQPPLAGPPDSIWEMREEQRQTYLKYFDTADKDKDGFVNGSEAKAFFTMSKLSSAALRDIWLLSDIDQDNKLNRDEFLIAMHLTMTVRMSGVPLPKTLPASLDFRQKQQHQQQPEMIDLLGPIPATASNVVTVPAVVPDLLSGISSSGTNGVDGAGDLLEQLSLSKSLTETGPTPDQEKELQNTDKEIHDLHRKLASASAQVEEQQISLQSFKSKVLSQKRERDELAESVRAMEAELTSVSAERHEYQELYQEMHQQFVADKERVEELRRSIDAERAKTKDFNKQLADGRHEMQLLQDQKQELDNEVKDLKQEVEDKELAVVLLEQSIADIRKQIELISDVSMQQSHVLIRVGAEHDAKQSEAEQMRRRLAQTRSAAAAATATAAAAADVESKTMSMPAPPSSNAATDLEWPDSTGVDDDVEFTFPEISDSNFTNSPSLEPDRLRPPPADEFELAVAPSSGSVAASSTSSPPPPQRQQQQQQFQQQRTEPQPAAASEGAELFGADNDDADLEFPMDELDSSSPPAWSEFSVPDVAGHAADGLASDLVSNPFADDADWGELDVAADKAVDAKAGGVDGASTNAAEGKATGGGADDWAAFEMGDPVAASDAAWAEFS